MWSPEPSSLPDFKRASKESKTLLLTEISRDYSYLFGNNRRGGATCCKMGTTVGIPNGDIKGVSMHPVALSEPSAVPGFPLNPTKGKAITLVIFGKEL